MQRVGKIRNGLQALAALAIGSVLSAVLLEGAVLLTLGPQVRFPRHVVGAPWGLRINEPGARYRHKSPDVEVWFTINRQGMRADRDYAYEKPAGRQRIVTLGDSFTAGYEVDEEQTFARVMERALQASGADVEVLNAGVSGFGTAEQYLYLERELWKYSPDVVVLSFYTNDYMDNVRSGLFRLSESGALEPAAASYVPAGGLGDFLNTNPVFNWLSGYSNAFALVKERVNGLAKRQMVAENLANVDAQAADASPQDEADRFDRKLAVAILNAIAESARAHHTPLVLMSIPFRKPAPLELVETFPARFDVAQPGVWFLPAKRELDAHLPTQLLYWNRSHGHWTPFAHARAGEALARLIESEGLLDRRAAATAP